MEQLDLFADIRLAETISVASQQTDDWLRLYYLAACHTPHTDPWYAVARKLYSLGGGLFMVAHRRWATDLEPAECMGYMWESLLLAICAYQPHRGVPFRAYWLARAREKIQQYRRTTGQGLVLTDPALARKGVRAEIIHATDDEMEVIYAGR